MILLDSIYLTEFSMNSVASSNARWLSLALIPTQVLTSCSLKPALTQQKQSFLLLQFLVFSHHKYGPALVLMELMSCAWMEVQFGTQTSSAPLNIAVNKLMMILKSPLTSLYVAILKNQDGMVETMHSPTGCATEMSKAITMASMISMNSSKLIQESTSDTSSKLHSRYQAVLVFLILITRLILGLCKYWVDLMARTLSRTEKACCSRSSMNGVIVPSSNPSTPRSVSTFAKLSMTALRYTTKSADTRTPAAILKRKIVPK